MRLLLFLFNPFLSGIQSLIDIKEKNARIFLYLWFLIFGMGFVAVNEAADSFRYVEFFHDISMTWSQYVQEVKEYFTFDSYTKDIYQLTVFYIVSSFTDNYHWIFFIFAIVFGYFYIKSLNYLVPLFSKSDIYSFILLFIFCFSNPIFNINGFRFWTAAWMGVYACLKIFIDRKYPYYLLLAITPLIHVSFFIWIVLVIIAQIVPKNKNLWITLYMISMFLSLGNELTSLSSYTSLLPPFMANMFSHYTTNEELLATYDMSALPLYARILKTLPSVMITVLTLIIAFNLKRLNKKDKYYTLFNIYLVLVTLINLASVIPTVGVRFSRLTIPFLVLVWAKYRSVIKENKIVLLFVPVAYAYSIFNWARNMISVTDIELYLYPAPVTIIKYLFL